MSLKQSAYIVCLGLGLGLSACDIKKPNYPPHERPSIEATISSDGKLLAVLDRKGTTNPRLRIKWVDKNDPWQELPAPMLTSSIRFGLKGYGLLLTHRLPSDTTIGQLTRWDVSDLHKPSEFIHQGPYLTFPVEVKPNEYLARSCIPLANIQKAEGRDSCITSGGGTGAEWMLIKPGQEPVQLTPRPYVGHVIYSQPNVTEQGFFWVLSSVTEAKTPRLKSFAFPGARAPEVDVSRFTDESQVECDYSATRCLRSYVAAKDPKTSAYIYDKEVILGAQRCQPEGLRGYSDLPTLTPDGRAALIPLASAYDQPRHVVVLKFKPGQCEPTSIQHIPLEVTQP